MIKDMNLIGFIGKSWLKIVLTSLISLSLHNKGFSQEISISGPTSANQNDTDYYNVYDIFDTITDYYWDAGSNQILSEGETSATIKWTQSGNQYLYYEANTFFDYYWGETVVSVASSGPSNPPNPTITTSGVCSNGQATLTRSGSPPSGVTWYWQGKTSNGTSTSKGSGTTFIANEGSGNYYIRARNSSNQWSSGSGVVNVIITNNPPTDEIYITGGGVSCGSGNAMGLTIADPARVTDNTVFKLKKNGTEVANFTKTVDQEDWSFNYTGTAGTYTVTAASFGCEVTIDHSTTITNTPPPPADPTLAVDFSYSTEESPDNFCVGNIRLQSQSGVKWYRDGGTYVGTGSTYIPTALGVHSYHVTQTTTNACGVQHTGTSASKTITVIPFVGQIPTPTGPSNRCMGSGSSNYYATTSNASSYSWSLSPASAGTIISNGEVTWSATYSGIATVTAYAHGCGPSTSASKNVDVYAYLSAGSVNGAKTICYNASAGTLSNVTSPSNGDGSYTYLWQVSSNNSSWSTASGTNNQANYSPGNLTSTRYYRRRVQSCTHTSYTGSVKITVRNPLNAGAINGSKTICYNGSAGTLGNSTSPSNGDGSYTYLWQVSSNNSSWSTASGTNNQSTYSPGNLTSTKYYRRRIQSCNQTAYTSSVTVTVRNPLSAGTINGTKTICYNGSAGTLGNSTSPLNGDGSYTYLWQVSSNNSSWSTASGTNNQASYSPGNLTSTKYYRRRVQSCNQTAYASSVTVTVRNPLSAGTINGTKTICFNGSAGTLGNSTSPLNGDGSYTYLWQVSSNNSSWSTASGTNNQASYSPGNLTSTKYYRRRVQSCNQTAYTSSVTVTVRNPLSAGTINGIKTICFNGSAGTMGNSTSPSNGDGSYTYLWQVSSNNSSWSTASGTNNQASYSPPGTLTSTKYFRRRVQSCNQTAYTSSVTITVHGALSPGSIGNPQTLCYNTDATSITSTEGASGGVSRIYQWESSTISSSSGFSNAPGISDQDTYDPGNLTETTWFRRMVVSGSSCGTATTSAVEVTVLEDLTAGSIGNSQVLCYNSDPTEITNISDAAGGASITYQWEQSTTSSSIGFSDIIGETGNTFDPDISTQTTWYRRKAISGSGCGTVSTTAVQITIDPLPIVSAGLDIQVFESNAITLSGESPTGGIWSGSGVTGNNFDGSTAGVGIHTITYDFTDANGCFNSDDRLVTVNSNPLVSLSGPSEIAFGESVTLTASPGHNSYQWKKDEIDVAGATTNTHVVTTSGDYTVQVTTSDNYIWLSPITSVTRKLASDENYVMKWSFRKKNIDAENIPEDPQWVTRQTDYFDGLGRAVQTVTWRASPGQYDIVQPIVYDNFGRVVQEYLPFTNNSEGLFNDFVPYTDANYSLSTHYLFYQGTNDNIVDDTRPYNDKTFDNSPLNRVIYQSVAGENWQTNQVEFSYSSNTISEVLIFDWEVLLTGAQTMYDANELYKSGSTDEDGNLMLEYKNKKGQVVLKKLQVDETNNIWASTYYVYDDRDLLRVVIPPEATNKLSIDFFGKPETERQDFLNKWAFQYDYDPRKRMTSKKIPGADEVLMVYDQWDRLILSQDGNQRSASTAEWSFTKYDILNRPILTGIMYDSPNIMADIGAMVRFETFDSTQSSTFQYTSNSYPTDGSGLIKEYLSITYYDNYDFLSGSTLSGTAYSRPIELNQETDDLIRPELNTQVQGQVTGTITRVIGTGNLLASISYYDHKYRLIQMVSENHLGGVDVVSNQHSFIGEIKKIKSVHDNGTTLTNILLEYDYDHSGRLMDVFHQIDDGEKINLFSNEYNELGQLIDKKLHVSNNGDFKQSIDYEYNIRGWLRSINKSGLSGSLEVPEPSDFFNMELIYNTSIDGLPNNQL
ncbi:MAG: hypothetical protein JXQ96_06380 [Cyclobacteriaceae bacterium]